MVGAHDHGSPGPGDEHCPDDEVRAGHELVDAVDGRAHGGDAAPVQLVEVAEPVDVEVEDRHVGAHARGDHRRMGAGAAGAEHGDPGRWYAGDTADEHPAPALGPLEMVGARLGGHAAGDLAHRGQQRERSRRQLHGLVGDGGRAACEQAGGGVGVGSEVEEREEGLVLAQHGDLMQLRLLHLEDHVGFGEHVGGGGNDASPDRNELRVRERRPGAGSILDDDLVTARSELANADRGDGDPILFRLDLGRYSDAHGAHTFLLAHDSGRVCHTAAGAAAGSTLAATERELLCRGS